MDNLEIDYKKAQEHIIIQEVKRQMNFGISLLSALIVIKTGQNIKGAIGWTFYRSRHFAFAPNVRTLL